MKKKIKKESPAGTLTLELSYVKLIRQWIDVPLHGEKVRVRNAIVQAFEPSYQKLEADRVKILTDMAEKDKDGKPVMEDGNFKIAPEKHGEFQTKFAMSMTEKADISISKQQVKVLIDILLNNIMKSFNVAEGAVYDDVISVLEAYVK